MKTPQLTHERIIAQWTECDLTQRADTGDLPRAYEVDEQVSHVQCLLACGARPFIVGEQGVGKTAIIHEVVRRVREAGPAHPLSGKRVLQLSFARRAAALRKPDDQMRPEMQKLVDALVNTPDVVVCLCDAHLADPFDLEPHLESLALRLPGLMLCEGLRAQVDTLFENRAGLAQHFVLVNVEEPTRDRVGAMLQDWSADQALSQGTTFEASALQTALDLSDRFLTRSRMPRKVLDLLVQTAKAAGPGANITREQIIDRFCITSSIPRLLADAAVPLDPADVHAWFAARVMGQPEAVLAMAQTVVLVKTGLSDVRRPLGAFLFVGPTGVGKTHVAQSLAEFLFGSRDSLIRLNMADHQAEASAGALFGDPEQYRRPLLRGLLTQRLSGRNFGVLLLDEFEKAHARVHDRFLQLIDEGSFINGAGETVSCRSMIIIATSNAGAEVHRGEIVGFGAGGRCVREHELARRLGQHFRIELLNRFDRVVQFGPLEESDVRGIAVAELNRLRDRGSLSGQVVGLDYDQAVVDWLVRHGYQPDCGARFLCHTVQRHVATAVGEALLRAPRAGGLSVVLTVEGDVIRARVRRSPPACRLDHTAVANAQTR